MATTLYLRDLAPVPPEPGLGADDQSVVLPVGTGTLRKARLAALSTTAPTAAQQALGGATALRSLPQVAHQDMFLGRFVSSPLAAQNVTAGNWTLTLQRQESHADANAFVVAALYVWRPGVVVGMIYDSDAALGIEWASGGPTGGAVVLAGAGPIAAVAGDRLVLEVWVHAAQATAIRRGVGINLDHANSSLLAPIDLSFLDATVRDFTAYDAYLDQLGVLFYTKDVKPATDLLPLRPVRQDTGANPDETRPEYGDFFAQGDFSHGSGQTYYHHEGNDRRKFYASEGFDISKPGKLTHLWDVAQVPVGSVSTAARQLAVAANLLFVSDATAVKRGDGTFPGVWTAEDPMTLVGDGAVSTINDIASSGDELYTAHANGHIHKRDGAGVWTHVVQPGTAAARLRWAKDRLIAFDTGTRTLYEVVGTVARVLEQFAPGWIVWNIGENGTYVYAAANHPTAALSRIHHYGLDDSGTLVKKGSTPMPRNQLAWSVQGYLDVMYVGAGKINSSNGQDPVLYQAFPDAGGALRFLKVADQPGTGIRGLMVKAILPIGEAVVCGWSLDASSVPAGAGPRNGLAIHHIGRDAFSHHIGVTAELLAGTLPSPVESIIFFQGRLLYTTGTGGGGLFYEDIGHFAQEAFLISSIADWNNAGLKCWDLIELVRGPVAASTDPAVTPRIFLDYTTQHPDNGAWVGAMQAHPSLDPAPMRLRDVNARQLSVRLRSLAATDQLTAPEINSFSVRSLPKPVRPEWALTRYVRLLPEDRKDENAEPVYLADVGVTRAAVQDLAYTWLTLYEPDATWTVRVESVEDMEPEEPMLSGTAGESAAEGYILKLQMVGTRESP